MVLVLPGGGSKGGGGCEGQDIGPLETEYGRTIYCDTTDYGALRGGGVAAGSRVPQRWWEQLGIDWSLAREKTAATTAQAGANVAQSDTPGSGAEAEPAPTPGWTIGGCGEEASLGVSGSSGAEWSGAED